MTALLDTSAVIGMIERTGQSPSVRELLLSAESDADVLVTDITLGELRHAVRAAPVEHREQRALTYDVAEALTVLSVNADFGTIDAYALARSTPPRCSQNDTWIIALALSHDATLHTEDENMARLAGAIGVPVVVSTSRSVD